MAPEESKEVFAKMTETEGAAKVARESFEAQIALVKGQVGNPATEVLILPDGKGGLRAEGVKSFLDPYRKHPERRTGNARLSDLDSMIAHVNRFKDAGTALFAWTDAGIPKLTAVIDYHPEGHASPSRFCEHQATYIFPLSDEWQVWKAVHDKALAQQEFAEFLEDHILDVMPSPPHLAPPPLGANRKEAAQGLSESEQRLSDLVAKIDGKIAGPGKLMELAKGLQVNDKQIVKEIINTASGEVRLQFDSEHQDAAGKPINVPNLVLIAIPVFKEGAFYQIPVRLRYRVVAGRINWKLQMFRADRTYDHAIREASDKACEETGCQLFYGAPES